MAYKYEVENKAKTVKIRVLIAVYIMFVVSSILIGVAVRLEQIQNIKPIDPKAADGTAVGAISQASDPTYAVRQLGALAYCDVIDEQGQTTGEQLPLGVRFIFRQIIRDAGQYAETLPNVCGSATSGACNWRTISNPNARCLNGQTVAQCNPADFNACNDNAIPGAMFYHETVRNTSATDYTAIWPGSDALGNLVLDDNEVDVFLNMYQGDLSGDTIVRNGITYTLDKNVSTVGTGAIFPIYRWQCNNDVCEGPGVCTNNGISYSDAACVFGGGTFNCPTHKYARYALSGVDNTTYYYHLSGDAGQVGSDSTWVKMGIAYDSFADSTYDAADPSLHLGENLIQMDGNIAKFRMTCQAIEDTTDTPSVTPSVLISASKTGPVCVERIAPNNEAPFTIVVTNNGDSAVVVESVEDSLPQGFSYKPNSTSINGVVVPDTFVTTVNSGTSQLVTFAPPADQPLWTLDVGQTQTITFTAIASATAVTGTNTNRVVINVGGSDSIDNISYQFPVEQTCNPETGLLDEPILVFALSGVILIFGLYLLYAPGGAKFFNSISGVPLKIEKRIKKKERQLRNKATSHKKFEKRVLSTRKKRKKKSKRK